MRDRDEKGRLGDRRGENNGRNKLTEADVINIRAIFKYTKATKSHLARMYKVGWTAIGDIISRKSWAHVK